MQLSIDWLSSDPFAENLQGLVYACLIMLSSDPDVETVHSQ